MKNLVIDIGNSSAKMAVFERDKLIHSRRILYFDQKALLSVTKDFPDLEKCLISTVVDIAEEVREFMNEKLDYIEMDEKTPLPIKSTYGTPSSLGKDRLAAAVMGNYLYPGENVLIVEAGTAITYDFVDSRGVFQGGGISPGVDMRFKALHTFTKRLPLVEKRDFSELIGNNTENSILSGVINGVREEVDGIIQKYRELTENQLHVIIGGGDCIYFDRKLKNNIFVLQNIVIEGLNKILLFNFE